MGLCSKACLVGHTLVIGLIMLIYLWSNSRGDNWFSVQRAKREQTSKNQTGGHFGSDVEDSLT